MKFKRIAYTNNLVRRELAEMKVDPTPWTKSVGHSSVSQTTDAANLDLKLVESGLDFLHL